jgi:hypothetical protein
VTHGHDDLSSAGEGGGTTIPATFLRVTVRVWDLGPPRVADRDDRSSMGFSLVVHQAAFSSAGVSPPAVVSLDVVAAAPDSIMIALITAASAARAART